MMPLGSPDPRRAIRCSACATMIAQGGSFCSACGVALATPDQTSSASEVTCPACANETMIVWRIAPSEKRPVGFAVQGCRGCGAAWVAPQALDGIVAAVTVAPLTDGGQSVERRRLDPGAISRSVKYRGCPVCGESMLRRNFGRVSGIVVDQCRQHGTLFDAGELEGVLEFVRTGGLLLARRQEALERTRDEKAQAFAAAAQQVSPGMGPAWMEAGFEVGDPTYAFLRWATRWVRDLFRQG